MRCWPLVLLLPAVLWPPPARAIKRRKDTFLDFGSPACFAGMIQGAVYDLPENTIRLPSFQAMAPVSHICTYTLDVPTRSWTIGMPGVIDRLEWFAIDYHADFWVEEPGKYTFSIDSDDGSNLYIDGRLIVYNDGVHQTENAIGTVKLAVGMHHLEVAYFQGPKYEVALVLNVTRPNGKLKLFDIRDYRMPAQAPPTAMDDEQRPILRRAESAHDPLAARLFEQAALEALKANPPPRAFDFRLSAFRFRPGPGNTQYSIALEVPGAGIKVTPGAGQVHRLHIVLLALVRDAAGRVVEKFSQDFPFAIPESRLPAFQAGSFSYTRTVVLAPGRYTVEAAVADREAGQASVRKVEFENPAPYGLALSDLLLVKKLEDVSGRTDAADPLEYRGKRALPELSGAVRASAHPFVYFLVYPDAAVDAKPRLEVSLALEGVEVARQTADLPPPDESGAIPMSLATVPAPGNYRIRIAVEQGGQRAERVLDYSLTAQ